MTRLFCDSAQATKIPLASGEWKPGWYGSVAPLGGIRNDHFDFVLCCLPQWRVPWEEPKDLQSPPEIPEGAEWKYWLVG